MTQKKYVNGEYIPLTPEEIAALTPTPEDIAREDWDFANLSQRVQITLIWIEPDDCTLNPAQKTKLKNCLQYWQLAELPSKRRNGFVYLYFDSLAANQLAFLATIGVVPTDRPVKTTL